MQLEIVCECGVVGDYILCTLENPSHIRLGSLLFGYLVFIILKASYAVFVMVDLHKVSGVFLFHFGNVVDASCFHLALKRL